MSLSNRESIDPKNNGWALAGLRMPQRDPNEVGLSTPSRRRNRMILIAAATVLIAVAVSVAVVLTKGNKEDSKTPAANETLSPPVNPPATLRPTGAATTQPTAATITERFISGLPEYSKKLAFGNASSPQAKALAWLHTDPKYNEYPLYRLNQRYALAVLYYSTSGASWWSKYRWLSNSSECTWHQDPHTVADVCRTANRLLCLALWDNELHGPLPAELELLVDLEYMDLDGTLAGTIHSELYVSLLRQAFCCDIFSHFVVAAVTLLT
jgi:hypothetical protein